MTLALGVANFLGHGVRGVILDHINRPRRQRRPRPNATAFSVLVRQRTDASNDSE
jgi:hypothetical protein